MISEDIEYYSVISQNACVRILVFELVKALEFRTYQLTLPFFQCVSSLWI